MKQKISDLIFKEEGVTSIEYALISSLIAMVIVSAVAIVGQRVLSLYQAVVNCFP